MMTPIVSLLLNWACLMEWWHERRREADLLILWPACLNVAITMGMGLNEARAAFCFHALNDAAWLVLGADEVCRIIDKLE